VRLERDVEPRDPYARLLAYVYRASDGLFVNLALAREGFARPLSIAPNTVHAADIGAAADDARAAGRGLWAACTGPT
jgi:micrococcal nuclease